MASLKERQKLCLTVNLRGKIQIANQKIGQRQLKKMALNQNDTRYTQVNAANAANAIPTVELRNQHLRKKNLTDEERTSIVNWLLLRCQNGKLEKNSISGAATCFNVKNSRHP